ncbi:hypothetical protein Sjap_008036 [Stephania japonica]|uniref:STAS domain-containing protein n=1 Tax=Stephania japonica TaxID=461633 RepID=A0AAP0JNV0_9MAGN
MGCVGSIDTSGTSMIEEVRENLDRRGLKLASANPGSEVIKKLDKSKCIETIEQDWIFLTIGEAVAACRFMLHASCFMLHMSKPDPTKIDDSDPQHSFLLQR